MGWYDYVKSYVWDDRTTPYLVAVPRLSRPQADKELLVYTALLVIVFSVGTLFALVQARAQHNSLFYLAALHAATVVWAAVYLGFSKRSGPALYCMSAPLAALAGFATGVINPHLRTIETVLLSALCIGWLWYSRRVLAIARAYEALPAELPPEPPAGPPFPPMGA
jgi:hypothetical protein